MRDRLEWIQVGPHRIRLEPPDQVHLQWDGDVTAEHVRAMFDVLESMQQPQVFVINDLTRSGTPNENARKYMAKEKRMRLLYAMACVGASYPIQVLVNLVMRAVSFFLGGKMLKWTFVQHETEARAWLEAQRSKLAAPGHAQSEAKP